MINKPARIWSIFADGFKEMPPESKVIPFPTKATDFNDLGFPL